MKTAISLPDPVFKEAEQYARRTGKSRSQLYVEALEEYLARHQVDAVTAAVNAVVEASAAWEATPEGKAEAAFMRAAANHSLKREVW